MYVCVCVCVCVCVNAVIGFIQWEVKQMKAFHGADELVEWFKAPNFMQSCAVLESALN